MPQKIACRECHYILYENDILKPPMDIRRRFDGRCPNCNRKLIEYVKSKDVTIKT